MRIRTALVIAALLAATPAFGHSAKQDTVPADGAVLDAPPKVIAMSFDSPVRVTSVALTNAKGEKQPVSRKTGTDPVTRFEMVPGGLAPGQYRVEWRALSTDGHPIKGAFGFTLK